MKKPKHITISKRKKVESDTILRKLKNQNRQVKTAHGRRLLLRVAFFVWRDGEVKIHDAVKAWFVLKYEDMTEKDKRKYGFVKLSEKDLMRIGVVLRNSGVRRRG
jgi:hypothetical protein